MPSGSSLKFMMDALPDAPFGIAEQHAVTLSAGMATQELVFATSTHTLQARFHDI
jgi:1-deoxy-D-xylulose-5-phosphate synthase